MLTHEVLAWVVIINNDYFLSNRLGSPCIFRTREQARIRARELKELEPCTATPCHVSIEVRELYP